MDNFALNLKYELDIHGLLNEESTLNSNFLFVSVHKNQSILQNLTHWLVGNVKVDWFLCTDTIKEADI